MRNHMENFIVSGINNNRQRAQYLLDKKAERIANPRILSVAEKQAIKFEREQNALAHTHVVRKPIFDRTKLPKSLGDMIAQQAMLETQRRESLWNSLMVQYAQENMNG